MKPCGSLFTLKVQREHMFLIPTKKQWAKWSMPSKLTALGFYLAVISMLFGIVFYISIKAERFLVSKVGIDEIRVDQGYVAEKTGRENSDVDVRYPKLSYYLPNDFLARINEEIKNTALGSISENIKEYTLDYNVGLIMPNLISFKQEQFYDYHGAAHGFTSISTMHINPINKEIIDFFDIFDQQYNALTGIKDIIKPLVKNECGGVFIDKFNDPSYVPRFMLRSQSIEFVFSTYEITGGACGSYSFSIDYQLVKRYINNNGPLAMLASPSGSWNAVGHFMYGGSLKVEYKDRE